MNGRKAEQSAIDCTACRACLQEYLEGTMVKTESLQIFLHLRTCPACAAECARWQESFQLLDSLPVLEVPPDFDRKILASIPYESYRAMADLRRPRVPVFLEKDALPAVVRSWWTRLAGLIVAAGSAVAMVGFEGPHVLIYPALAGLLPEVAVRLQDLGRLTVSAMRRSEG